MTKREIGALVCRILGMISLYHGILAIAQLWIIIPMLNENGAHGQVYSVGGILTGYIGPIILLFFFGLLLFIKAERFAKVILPEADDTQAVTSINSKDIMVIAFATIGLFVLAEAVPQIPALLSKITSKAKYEGVTVRYLLNTIEELKMSLITLSSRLVVGLLVLFYSNSFVGWLSNLWTAKRLENISDEPEGEEYDET